MLHVWLNGWTSKPDQTKYDTEWNADGLFPVGFLFHLYIRNETLEVKKPDDDQIGHCDAWNWSSNLRGSKSKS
jgi:hypothetical protein